MLVCKNPWLIELPILPIPTRKQSDRLRMKARGAVRLDQFSWASPIRVRVGAAVAEYDAYPAFTTTQVTAQN